MECKVHLQVLCKKKFKKIGKLLHQLYSMQEDQAKAKQNISSISTQIRLEMNMWKKFASQVRELNIRIVLVGK